MLEVQKKLASIQSLRDVQFGQSLDYPSINVKLDREKASSAGTTAAEVARSVVAATSSTRFIAQNYWPDPKTGIGYQVQIEIPQSTLTEPADLAAIPVTSHSRSPLLLRDVAQLSAGTMPGQFDRYNMKREITLTANISGADLGSVSTAVRRALDELEAEGKRPKSVTTELRGQLPPLRQILSGLGVGLALAIIVVFLLLTASFQSMRLALVSLSTIPAVLCGVLVTLAFSGATLNLQSFIGAIMAIGVAMANAILLVTFAEQARREGSDARAAATIGAERRLRAILMTGLAMTCGMLPMAWGLSEAGSQSIPLGRAVVGGLIAATFATLLVLPAVFAMLQQRASVKSVSLDPLDPASPHYSPSEASPS
jgi:multidrug efflux pump subunit AcrB